MLALVEGDAGTVPEARLVRSHSGARVGPRPELRRIAAIAAGLGGWVHVTGAGCEHVGDDEAVICVPTAVTQ